MVERVAKAMWESNHEGRWEDWRDGQDVSRQIYKKEAALAIEAMREPTIDMVQEGDDYRGFSSRTIWQAMIDEALT